MSGITMYTKDFCPYCTRIKSFFDQKGLTYTDIDVTHDPDTLMKIVQQTNMRTVPQVFIGDTFCGGHDDVIALEREGKLQPLLDAL